MFKNCNLRIIKNIVSVYKNFNNKTNLETQFLFGEKVKIINEKKNWYFCKSQNDDYKGWILKNAVGSLPEPTHKTIKLNTLVFSKPNIKSQTIMHLSYNSLIKVEKSNKEWTSFKLPNNKIGYILTENIVSISKKRKNIIKNIKLFFKVPYLWGGKSFLGIDCSGLIQLILNNQNLKFPRNSKDQMICQNEFLLETENLEKNVLVFWENHVALGVSENKIIHANAFHKCVEIENFESAEKRIKKEVGEILCMKKIIV